PAMSMEVERVFSHGQLLLSHVCNQISAQATCALLCLGKWSLMEFVHDDSI
ncbi:hypothetical protein K443DRAFT_78459, partial [Laccaria amethystina LaAM-08-1]